MCGIVGYIGPKQAQPILLESLKRLEYRGYDSAGVAIISNGKKKPSKKRSKDDSGLVIFKDKGTIDNLKSTLKKTKISGQTGISHTRWATHGPPSKLNAHPHNDCSGKLALESLRIFKN
jgi:glucosamine--fructose-6-phosphate aminotransferase (isomerizing)